MQIARDRFLDDTRQFGVSVSMQTRTPEMHSLLADAPEDVRERVGEILAAALDQVQHVIAPLLDRRTPPSPAAPFGCGT